VQLVPGHEGAAGDEGGDLGAMPREPSSEELQEVTGECRICQEEDVVSNLDNPCSCAGSLKVCWNATWDPGPRALRVGSSFDIFSVGSSYHLREQVARQAGRLRVYPGGCCEASAC